MKYIIILLLLLASCSNSRWCVTPTEPLDRDVLELQIDAWLELEIKARGDEL